MKPLRHRPRVTHELITFHRTRVQQLRVAAYRDAWRRLRGWLGQVMRRR